MSQPDPREVARLLGEGKTLTEIAAQLEGPHDGPTDAELAHAQAVTSARTGGFPPGEEPQTPAQTAMLNTFRQARAGGASVEKATSYGLSVLMDRAANGDPTALFDENTWRLDMARRQGDAAYAVEAQAQQRRQGQSDYADAQAGRFLGAR